ncbi:MAG: hypothetical protein FH753_08305 [Firmicutes bacterium]|nr:hypothetical protein [Bacillota bacterium]
MENTAAAPIAIANAFLTLLNRFAPALSFSPSLIEINDAAPTPTNQAKEKVNIIIGNEIVNPAKANSPANFPITILSTTF